MCSRQPAFCLVNLETWKKNSATANYKFDWKLHRWYHPLPPESIFPWLCFPQNGQAKDLQNWLEIIIFVTLLSNWFNWQNITSFRFFFVVLWCCFAFGCFCPLYFIQIKGIIGVSLIISKTTILIKPLTNTNSKNWSKI